MSCKNMLVAGACGIAFGIMGCASHEETAAESRSNVTTPIIDGKSAADFPEAALIDIRGVGFCSGAIIAPRIALTAGHCVTDATQGFDVIAPYVNQRATGTKSWTAYVSMTVKGEDFVNPKTLDVAAIFLDTPINLPSYPVLADEPMPAGTKATNVGRILDNVLSNEQLFFGKAVALKAAPGFPFAYGSTDIIQPGDSGGPVYAGTGANRKIIAVNSGVGGGSQVLARVDLAFAKLRELIASGGPDAAPAAPAAPADCATREAEPNDEHAQANEATGSICGEVAGDDVDWFRWEIPNEGTAHPVALTLSAPGDAAIFVYRQSSTGWDSIPGTTASRTHFETDDATPGTYIVGVATPAGGAQSYRLATTLR